MLNHSVASTHAMVDIAITCALYSHRVVNSVFGRCLNSRACASQSNIHENERDARLTHRAVDLYMCRSLQANGSLSLGTRNRAQLVHIVRSWLGVRGPCLLNSTPAHS